MADVRDYGAQLDGHCDDSQAIKDAIQCDGTADIPYTDTGFVAHDVDLFRGQSIVGHGKPVWKIKEGADCGISLKAFSISQKAKIECIEFDGSAGDATAIRCATSNDVVYNARIHDCTFKYCREAIGDEASPGNYVVDLMVTDSMAYFTKGRQVYLRRTRGFLLFQDFRIDHTENTWQSPWEGARFEDVIGIDLQRFDVVGPTKIASVYQASSVGLVISGTPAGRMSGYLSRILVDNTRGPGILINNMGNIEASQVQSYQNFGPAIILNGVFNSSFSKIKGVGAFGVSGAPPNSSGIVMVGCNLVDISAPECSANTGHGIVVQDSSLCEFRGGSSTKNVCHGYVEAGSSNMNLVEGLNSVFNSGLSYVQTGAASVCSNVMPTGGVRINRIQGATAF